MSEVIIERSYWLGFSYFSGIGPGRFRKLLDEFGTAKSAWGADEKSLIKVIGPAFTTKFIDFREKNSPDVFASDVKKKKVSFLTLADKAYPELLREIKNPPFVLYYKGKLKFNAAENQRTIAIVGTRKITDYGKQVTENISRDFIVSGFVIVSGLALGVDAVAHKTAVDNKGLTIAVLGCGVDCAYPTDNKRLYDQIIETGGAVVSEFPPSMSPSVGSFPSRNRIIAGFSKAVIVTEGAADSGALYTAQDAFEIGRPVFAVPGPITSSLSKGPHGLISKGALLISGAEDVIRELGFAAKKKGDPPASQARALRAGTKDEQKVIDILQNESMHFDEIVKRTKISSSKLGGILSLMEMKGYIRGSGVSEFCLV